MNAYRVFIEEIKQLSNFYRHTMSAYHKSALFSSLKEKEAENQIQDVNNTHPNKDNKFVSRKRNHQHLTEIVFVRVVSVLEVFLIDLVKEVFLQNKEPFKKQDIILTFPQSELLSYKSATEIYNKIINRECRKLSSGGFSDVVKYYKNIFGIDLTSFYPGFKIMEKYHDCRHLLVHRLGKTDQSFRLKYNTKKQFLTVDEYYLMNCIKDFKLFGEKVNEHIKIALETKFNNEKQRKDVETSLQLKVTFLSTNSSKYFEKNFEFWVNDRLYSFEDILDNKSYIAPNVAKYIISGTFVVVNMFLKILRKAQENSEINLIKKNRRIDRKFVDDQMLKKIKDRLPNQPWEKGIHRIIAKEFNITNTIATAAIKKLIAQGHFCEQIDGKLIDEYVI